MGGSSWNPRKYDDFARSTASKPTAAIYTANDLKPELSPDSVGVREARDSVAHPHSTPIIVALDVTGSMGMIADTMARKGLGTLFKEILDREPVKDPQLMFMGIGDVAYDKAPLQVSQFESGPEIIEQLTSLYLEHGGGGNDTESYNLPWYFAAMHTSIDSFEKRGEKGYLFTVGDENAPDPLTNVQLKAVFGGDETTSAAAHLQNAELLQAVEKMYHVFHVIVEEGSCARRNLEQVTEGWRALLGQRVLSLSDHTKLSEVIVSAIQITEGADGTKVAKSWKGDTALVVANATRGLVGVKNDATSKVIRF